jgi:2,4-dienoyl-CoA reductase-like NADH-dependent reductase (Old Yellow Enzyme family)
MGLIIVEATTVSYERRRRDTNCLSIFNDDFLSGLEKLVNEVHQEGARIGMQLVDSLVKVEKTPTDMAKDEIYGIIGDFVQAAQRAYKIGVDLIEFHMAHLYTLADFLSKQTNKRKDEFGGSPEGRTKIAEEIITRTREILGTKANLACRINGDEFVLEGNTLADSLIVAQGLERLGINILDISAGGRREADGSLGYSFTRCIPRDDQPNATHAYLAAEIRKVINIPVITAGKLGDPLVAEKILSEGKADLIALGRPLLADPFFGRKAMEGKWDQITKCLCCNQCMDGILEGEPWSCILHR